MDNRLAIRVKLLDQAEYVEINKEMLSNHESFLRHSMFDLYKEFEICIILFSYLSNCLNNSIVSIVTITVLNIFGFDPTQAGTAYLYDQDNFRIPMDLFPVIIPNFVNSSTYIKVVFTLHDHIAFDMVSDY